MAESPAEVSIVALGSPGISRLISGVEALPCNPNPWTVGNVRVTVAECTLVFDSFREFVRVNQTYLNIMIGKAGILSRTPLAGPPVASTFKEMERFMM